MRKIFLILAFVSTLVSCEAQQEDSSRGYKVEVGQQAPKIDLQLLDGGRVTTESLKGKVVVLQFTASWCSVCREEMPHLEKEVWQRFKGDNFILIAVDLKENPEKIKPFIAKTGITYPVAMDSDGKLFEAYTKPKAGVTRNIVIDKNGKIVYLTRLYEREEFEKMVDFIDKELKK